MKNKIDIKDIPFNAKLCFVGNDDNNQLCCYFTTNKIEDVWGKDWEYNYNKNNKPKIYKEEDCFYIILIKNFIKNEINGIETISYQKDNWLTFENLRIPMSIKTINSGGCAWLIKKSKNKKCDDIVLNSNTNAKTFLKFFKEYDMDFYIIKK